MGSIKHQPLESPRKKHKTVTFKSKSPSVQSVVTYNIYELIKEPYIGGLEDLGEKYKSKQNQCILTGWRINYDTNCRAMASLF